MPRRNHPPKKKSRKPRPQRDPMALERADKALIDSRLLADMAKRPKGPTGSKPDMHPNGE